MVSLTMKYADNILKVFATSISIVMSTVLSSTVLGTAPPQMPFIIGTAIVLISSVLYALTPFSSSSSCCAVQSAEDSDITFKQKRSFSPSRGQKEIDCLVVGETEEGVDKCPVSNVVPKESGCSSTSAVKKKTVNSAVDALSGSTESRRAIATESNVNTQQVQTPDTNLHFLNQLREM